MWPIKEQKPHYKTIANFRKDNPKAFKSVFGYFVALLKDRKLIDGKTIAIDSFKMRAQNSLKNNFNERKVKRHIDYIDKRIAEYEQALDQEFDQTIKDKLEHNHHKKENYQNIQRHLKESGDGQISTTDPDSRAVVFQRNSVKVGYNIQAASDSKNKLILEENGYNPSEVIFIGDAMTDYDGAKEAGIQFIGRTHESYENPFLSM